MDTLSKLSHTHIAQQTGIRYLKKKKLIILTILRAQQMKIHILSLSASLLFYSRPFPTEESVEDEDIYNHLEDLIE